MDDTQELVQYQAGQLLEQIYGTLNAATQHEWQLEQSWTHLGKLLLEFKNGEHWRAVGFNSFERFMMELRDKYNRGKTQLWSYLTVAETLLPTIDAATLEEIGITKALVLRRAVTQTQRPIPQEILDKAKDKATTIKELRAIVGAALHLPDMIQDGTWFDFDGCFMTPEEREEFKDTVRLTATLLELKKGLPEHVQRKEIFFAWLREFRGTHATEVYGPRALASNN